MKRSIYVCVLLFCCLAGVRSARAQQGMSQLSDSLKQVLSRQKTAKDSLYVLQKMVDIVVPVDDIALFEKPDYVTPLLQLNKKLRLIDPAPYEFLQQAVQYNNAKQYRQELTALESAIHEFDKQHKVLNSILIYIRLLYNKLNDQEGRFKFFKEQLEYYQVHGPVENTAPCYHGLAGYYSYKGAYNLSISNYLKAGEVYRKFNPSFYANEQAVAGNMYARWGNYGKAIFYLGSAIPLEKKIGDSVDIAFNYFLTTFVFFKQHKYGQALQNINAAIAYDTRTPQTTATYYSIKGQIYLRLGQPLIAWPILKRAKAMADSGSFSLINTTGALEIDYALYEYYRQAGDNTAAEKYLLAAEKKATVEGDAELHLTYLQELGTYYKALNKPELSLRYFTEYLNLSKDQETSLNEFKVAQYEIDQNDKQQKQHIDQLKQQEAVQEYQISRRNSLLWGSLVVLFLISGLLVFIYRQLHINKRTLISLRQTQRQLIQSEKMASLGELTAGIAHEIQNPLNFVNNFSDVNREMIDELKEELKSGNLEEVLAIADDIQQNEEKINHHGKRADSIVKGMLEHSRVGTGEKQPTDLNVLADEFLKLSYHGLRAKDKSFNAEIITHFDPALPKTIVVQQDIGRVMLNLFNNAFYAVNQKMKTASEDYKPQVSVETFFLPLQGVGGFKVRDNGPGIPDAIKDKIMQPFLPPSLPAKGQGWDYR